MESPPTAPSSEAQQTDASKPAPTDEPMDAMSGAVQSPDATENTGAKSDDVNGAVALPHISESSNNPETQDSEMKDDEEPDITAGAEEPVSQPNGTPASSKKQANGKRNRGVPEHKTKKLNKKKSSLKPTQLDAQPGQYYFARLKSYPPWPSIICDEEMLPTSLLSTRPVTTKQIDGTYKEAYADGGKRAYERTFPIMFLHTNEFAWIPNTELTPLKPEDCKDVSEKGKTKALLQAYQVAEENHDLQHFKDMLINHQKAMQEDQEQKEARQAAKAAREEKKAKRKSMEVTADEMDVDDDEVEKPKSSKKRKKTADSDGETEKPAKTPKTGTKLKLTTPKAPASAEPTKKKQDKTPKTKSAKKAKDNEDTAEPAKDDEKLTPEQALQKKEKEVLFLRHKLQKGFLSRDQPPQEDEMPAMSNFIKKLEEYGDLEVSIIRTTKINKVLKAMIKLDSIPKDEEHHFRDRSHDLLNKWNKLLGTEPVSAGEPSGASEKPITNGLPKDDPGAKEKPEDLAADGEEAKAGDQEEAPEVPVEKADEEGSKEDAEAAAEEAA